MIIPFILALFITFVVVRLLAHAYHDKDNYGTEKEKSKTLTFLLRKWTGFDWHHIHIGFLILLAIAPIIFFFGFDYVNTILLGIGISMVVDQIFPLIFRNRNYFHLDCLLISILGHLIIAIIAYLVYIKH